MIHGKTNQLLILLLFNLLLAGCVSEATISDTESMKPPVRTFYATDRSVTDAAEPAKKFGNLRGELSYGTCSVSIPPGHAIGKLEQSSDNDVREHIVLTGISPMNRQEFFRLLSDSATRSKDKGILFYIHGYNTSFEEAAMELSQLVSDLGFTGIPVMYSWPSEHSVGGYDADQTTIEWSQKNIRDFLGEALQMTAPVKYYMLAHSMGNRALTRAVIELSGSMPKEIRRCKAILLAAPDIDSQIFLRDTGPSLVRTGVPITLYASCRDRALSLSKKLHSYPRAGFIEGCPLLVTGIETIDASAIDCGFIGHSYYHESRQVISDLYYILNEGLRADKRFSLQPVDTGHGRYWRLKK